MSETPKNQESEYDPDASPTQEQVLSFLQLLESLVEGSEEEVDEHYGGTMKSRKFTLSEDSNISVTINKDRVFDEGLKGRELGSVMIEQRGSNAYERFYEVMESMEGELKIEKTTFDYSRKQRPEERLAQDLTAKKEELAQKTLIDLMQFLATFKEESGNES